MAKYTQKAIMDTFLALLEEKTLDKITVRDIVEKCEINRNTFYYYYRDIYELLEAVFRTETENFKKGLNPDTSFLEEYERAARIVLTYRKAVMHLYNSKERPILEKYLTEVSREFIGGFVEQKSENAPISAADRRFIRDFYCYALVGTTMRWIEEGLPPYETELVKRLSESFEATVQDMIDLCSRQKKGN